MSMQIENQGRHDGEGFRELARDLWENKPLLIVVLAGLALTVYLFARKTTGIGVPGSQQNPAPGLGSTSGGGYLLAVLEEPPHPPVNVTVNTPVPTTGSKPPVHPGPPPIPIPVPKPPVAPPRPAPKPLPVRPVPAPKPVPKPAPKPPPTRIILPQPPIRPIRTGGLRPVL